MKMPRTFLATLAVVAVSAAVVAGSLREANDSGAEMVVAAQRFVAALSLEQKSQALFSFDDPERLNWHFIPRERKGLSIKQMGAPVRKLAHGLLHSGLGRHGYTKAVTVMSLEAILHELERGAGRFRRDPDLYFFSLFGEPANQGRWGWRVEGHHLSLNYVVEDGRVKSATPTFFGANPAEVRSGPRSGLKTLAVEEELARDILNMLDDSQRRRALIAETAPDDVRAANTPQPPADAPAGLPAGAMSERQQQALLMLVGEYAANLPPDIRSGWLDDIERAGLENIHFAWAGGATAGQGHYYRIQGPTFLIEYANVQNDANHIHSVWRNMQGDFGVPAAQ
jgi:hypothetical protein